MYGSDLKYFFFSIFFRKMKTKKKKSTQAVNVGMTLKLMFVLLKEYQHCVAGTWFLSRCLSSATCVDQSSTQGYSPGLEEYKISSITVIDRKI